MKEIIAYLINFLANTDNVDYSNVIGYTDNATLFANYKLVIIPSSFFDPNQYGTKNSIPSLPLQEIEHIPLLFGTPEISHSGQTILIHADIIASTYFMLSRYEEWITTDAIDQHGRFEGKAAIAYRAGFLHRAIVDEYGKFLRKWMKKCGIPIEEKPCGFSKIYLTHDIDQLSKYRSFRGFAGGFFRSLTKKDDTLPEIFHSFYGQASNDPLYTFPGIYEINNHFIQTNKTKSVETIFFFKTLKTNLPEDKPYYNCKGKDAQGLLDFCHKNNIQIGLHTSYYSADNPKNIPLEKIALEAAAGIPIRYNRYHYLRANSAEAMEMLAQSGLSDDFSLGFASLSGFRLGTSKAVKYINPKTQQISVLTIHPLSIMDCTLESQQYMHLSYPEAFNNAKSIIDTVFEHHGELVLLFHNNGFSVKNKGYTQKLYTELLAYISNKK